MKLTSYLAALFVGCSLLTSCGEDFLNDMDSSTVTKDQISEESKKNPEKVLASQLEGCYTNWNRMNPFSGRGDINEHEARGFGGIMLLSDMMSNDISLALGSGDPWRFDHALDYNAEQYIRPSWPWSFFYTEIASDNDIINLVDEEGASDELKHILGQAYAFRGISHAYLAQFYQKTYADSKDKLCVPIRLSDKEESTPGRATVEKVYAQAEKDLLKAIDLLDGYDRGGDKHLVDKAVAQGLLSRVYLVMNRFADAAKMAHEARQGLTLNSIDDAGSWNYQDLDNAEVLWGWQPTDETKGYYASWASWRSYDGPGYGGVQVGAMQLVDAAVYNSMSDKDIRKTLFAADDEQIKLNNQNFDVPKYASKKFPYVASWLGNVVYMRAAELYLNEAEGLLMSGDASGAASVMNELMENRVEDWTPVSNWTQATIYRERRKELWGEGFGYFDCVRLRQDLVRNYEGTNEPAGSQTNVPASSYKWTYQIPKSEINDNDAISEDDQNPLQ